MGTTIQHDAGSSIGEIAQIYAQLDEDRQEELAGFAAQLLEEQGGGQEAPRPVTIADAERAAERLGVSLVDVVGALGFDD